MILSLLLLPMLSSALCANDTRFVHRRACFGADIVGLNSSDDMIGCAERAAMLFEHTLTPSMLWCNTTHCRTRFGDLLEVHVIDCNEERCHVLLHCDDKLNSLKQAALLTFLCLIMLICAVAYRNTIYTTTMMHHRRDNICKTL